MNNWKVGQMAIAPCYPEPVHIVHLGRFEVAFEVAFDSGLDGLSVCKIRELKPVPDPKQVAIDDIKNKLFTVNKKFTQDEIAEFIYDNYTQLEQAKEQLACSKTNFDILYKERDWFVDELEQTQKQLAQEKKKFLKLKRLLKIVVTNDNTIK
jgi:hypothetical protein